MLDVRDLVVSYSGIRAVREVSLSVLEGAMVALIGPNGAGKSSLLNAICGVLPAAAGSVTFAGVRVTGEPAYRVARRGLIQVPEGRRILGPLSVEDNLRLGAVAARRRGGDIKGDLARVLTLFPKLAERRRQGAGSLSGGEQQMLAIGRALMGRPRMLLLDEPSLGLAPIVVKQVFEALAALSREGMTMLLVEQNAKAALAATSYAYVLEQGRVAHQGASAALAGDAVIVEHYLGQATAVPP